MIRPSRFLFWVILLGGIVCFAPSAGWAQRDDSLTVDELILNTGVTDLTPVDTVSRFSLADGQAVAFAQISNPGSETGITFSWVHEGEVYAELPMKVGQSPRWRTYSSVQLKVGSWEVRVLGPDDEVLAQRSFQVTEK